MLVHASTAYHSPALLFVPAYRRQKLDRTANATARRPNREDCAVGPHLTAQGHFEGGSLELPTEWGVLVGLDPRDTRARAAGAPPPLVDLVCAVNFVVTRAENLAVA